MMLKTVSAISKLKSRLSLNLFSIASSNRTPERSAPESRLIDRVKLGRRKRKRLRKGKTKLLSKCLRLAKRMSDDFQTDEFQGREATQTSRRTWRLPVQARKLRPKRLPKLDQKTPLRYLKSDIRFITVRSGRWCVIS